MKGNRLYKFEKLCSRTAISRLFGGTGRSFVAYPLRVVAMVKPGSNDAPRFMITVPKKKIRHAVGRVLLRRRIREAYRLSRPLLLPRLRQAGCTVELAFIYMDKQPMSYATIEACMRQLLAKVADHAIKQCAPPEPNPDNDNGDGNP